MFEIIFFYLFIGIYLFFGLYFNYMIICDDICCEKECKVEKKYYSNNIILLYCS